MSAEATHEGHTDCSEVLIRIYEYLDGEIGEDDFKTVATHLAQCQPCLKEHDLDLAVKRAVKRCHQVEAAPAQVRFSVVQRITQVRIQLEE